MAPPPRRVTPPRLPPMTARQLLFSRLLLLCLLAPSTTRTWELPSKQRLRMTRPGAARARPRSSSSSLWSCGTRCPIPSTQRCVRTIRRPSLQTPQPRLHLQAELDLSHTHMPVPALASPQGGDQDVPRVSFWRCEPVPCVPCGTILLGAAAPVADHRAHAYRSRPQSARIRPTRSCGRSRRQLRRRSRAAARRRGSCAALGGTCHARTGRPFTASSRCALLVCCVP
jgi:hypothetical protein